MLPRGETIRRTSAARAKRALASRSVTRHLKRVWIAAAAGAILLVGASSFKALRANQPLESTFAAAALAPQRAAMVDAPQPATAAPQPFTRDASATVEVIGSALPAANLAALPAAPPLPVYPVPPARVRRAPTSASSVLPATPPPPPAARRRTKNALNYDFGL